MSISIIYFKLDSKKLNFNIKKIGKIIIKQNYFLGLKEIAQKNEEKCQEIKNNIFKILKN